MKILLSPRRSNLMMASGPRNSGVINAFDSLSFDSNT